ncbi:hypothetical protein [Streptomyces sp. CA-106110]|uniref:hypothetical protein n=1 Tax=Streptomyces sp. CA-106110 TaxID=3240044 RepID=UPI003D8F1A5C
MSVAHDAQKRTGMHVRQALRGRTGQAFTTKDVRSWLMNQGENVPHAGRLSNEQIKRYEEAHGL